MCGINGICSSKWEASQRMGMLKRMNTRLAHRGPDHEGTWQGEELSLGHRRLSIIDLSPESNQPFVSADGRYVIVYNGELYNYREIKLELQRSAKGSKQAVFLFRTASDTEVVLYAYLRYGAACLEQFNGMFAFAIYDTQEKTLFLARDRMGVKPLYYSYGEDGLIFSSEIRAILHSGFRTYRINKQVLSEYCQFQTVYTPNTIVNGIRVLEAGHYILYKNGQAEMTRYYDLNAFVKSDPELDYKTTCSRIHDLLAASIQRRLVSDVPFGAFLSGGIDSSIVVAFMSRLSSKPVETFNISFDEGEFSEARYAKQIASTFHTAHHDIRLSPHDFLNELPNALKAMDHPSGDGPNTYIVSGATKAAGISMALSGIGGDEVFAGYEVFKRMYALNQKSWLKALPYAARKGAAAAMRAGKTSVSRQKIAELLETRRMSFQETYPINRALFGKSELARLAGLDAVKNSEQFFRKIRLDKDHLLSAVSLAEMHGYLQHTLLRDTDQMSMAHALEVREPFLDHRLVEFVLGVKDEYKYPHSPKKLLVDSVGNLLPPEVVNRKKMGFVLPWQNWLKVELKGFCETQLKQLDTLGILQAGAGERLWKRFLAGDPLVNWSRVWHLVVLGYWLDEHELKS